MSSLRRPRLDPAAVHRGEVCHRCEGPIAPDAAVALMLGGRSARSWVTWCVPCLSRAADDWMAEHPRYSKTYAAMELLAGGKFFKVDSCVGCGREVLHAFAPWDEPNRRIICSPRCQHRVWNRVKHQPQVCTCCGREFVPKRTDSVYCGRACRQRAYRQRQAGS